ncbi:MAG: phosphomannomutase, partial [Alphaproteobacteria bacterium]
MTAHRLDPSILREYDIRGIVGDTLNEPDFAAIGWAFAGRVIAAGGRRVAVGYDGRLSSPALEAALEDGLIGVGVGVERIVRGQNTKLNI